MPNGTTPAGAIDWSDPCQRAQALHDAYMRLVSGEQESEVTYQANGVLRRVRYAAVSMSALLNELRAAQGECAAQLGEAAPRKRYAIVAGSRRAW